MEIDAVLEALKDFDNKGTKETCPCLEQLLCHIAKTGKTMIPWSQFKPYFLFKMEKVIDDFHEFTPEQRTAANPNVEYIPFEDMKNRILKIVDGYNGIPFTIQRLCELLMDPKRNYSGADKFLRGVEKNVMVVSCVYPTSEKNGATSVNRMNGAMFPGNSPIYSDSGNVNGPGTPKPLNRTKLSLTSSLSTNGLPDCTVGKVPNKVSTAVVVETHLFSDSSPSEGESTQSSGIKNKHPEEAGSSEGDPHEAKRLKLDEKEDEEEREDPTPFKASESLSETQESPEVTCQAENKGTSSNTSITSEVQEPSSTQTTPEREEESLEKEAEFTAAPSENTDITVGSPDEFPQSGKSLNLEVQDSGESGNGDGSPSYKSVPTSPSSTTDLSTEGADDNSETSNDPNEDHD